MITCVFELFAASRGFSCCLYGFLVSLSLWLCTSVLTTAVMTPHLLLILLIVVLNTPCSGSAQYSIHNYKFNYIFTVLA